MSYSLKNKSDIFPPEKRLHMLATIFQRNFA